MPKMGPVRKAFEVLSYVSIESYNEMKRIEEKSGVYCNPYSHLLLTLNDPPAVLCNILRRGHDKKQLRQRFGLEDGEELTLYSNDIIDRLMNLAKREKGKRGVDGAIIVGGRRGRLLLEEGTVEIKPSDDMEKNIIGKMASGFGRRAMQRISTISNVNGFMMSETYQVVHYAEGKRLRLFDPSRRTNSEKGVIIEGDREEIVTVYEKYVF